MPEKQRNEEPKAKVLYLTVKFPINPNPDQLRTLQYISDNLWLVRDEALQERTDNFETYFQPLYEQLKEARENGDEATIEETRKLLKEAYRERTITHFDQCKALTPRRKDDASFAAVPCAWQQETLKTLDGGFKSFFALRKQGDYTARPPRTQDPGNFTEIEGLLSFQIIGTNDTKAVARKPISETTREYLRNQRGASIVLSPGKSLPGGAELSFPLPPYAQQMLGLALRVKKFTLFRVPADLNEQGGFFISVVYEIPKPDDVPFVPEDATYIALGASAIGFVWKGGQEEVRLARPDKHWTPLMNAIDTSLAWKPPEEVTNLHQIRKGSRKWRKLQGKKRKMGITRSRQKVLDTRTVVSYLVGEATTREQPHFVVINMVVRGKKGALADGSKSERGGTFGLNWNAQNAGSIGAFVAWLEHKAAMVGGTVTKHRLDPVSGRSKIATAQALRDSFLQHKAA